MRIQRGNLLVTQLRTLENPISINSISVIIWVEPHTKRGSVAPHKPDQKHVISYIQLYVYTCFIYLKVLPHSLPFLSKSSAGLSAKSTHVLFKRISSSSVTISKPYREKSSHEHRMRFRIEWESGVWEINASALILVLPQNIDHHRGMLLMCTDDVWSAWLNESQHYTELILHQTMHHKDCIHIYRVNVW